MSGQILYGTVPEALSGSGYGSGDGYGYGSGDGSGYGDGYGNGYDDGSYWKSLIQAFAGKWGKAQQLRLKALEAAGATIAYWRSNSSGSAANGGSNSPVSAGTIEKSSGPLVLCERGTLHATLIPPKWKGERVWIVALLGKVVGNDEKFGALEREIIGECL